MLQASVLLSVLALGLASSEQDATYLFRRPGELIRALLAMNVLMPQVISIVASIPYLLSTKRRQPDVENQLKA